MKLLFLIVFIGATSSMFAQEEEGQHHENELGISMAPVLFKPSNELAFGLHAHYTRKVFGEFGVGLGAEYIFNEEQHQTYSAVFDYLLIDRLHITVAPGIALEKELDGYEG